MEQRISIVTLGVRDLEAARRFYVEKFGWMPLKDSDGIVFFQLNGLLLGLFPAGELAEDASVSAEGGGFRGVTLAYNVRTEQEVDELFAALDTKGVEITRKPEKVVWGGYRGYIADPDGHLWEIACNPFMELDEKGNVLTHR